MSDLRELTDAELDIHGNSGGKSFSFGPFGDDLTAPQPTGIKLVEEIIVDILRILEPQRAKPNA